VVCSSLDGPVHRNRTTASSACRVRGSRRRFARIRRPASRILGCTGCPSRVDRASRIDRCSSYLPRMADSPDAPGHPGNGDGHHVHHRSDDICDGRIRDCDRRSRAQR
jgi:hypothetical protein